MAFDEKLGVASGCHQLIENQILITKGKLTITIFKIEVSWKVFHFCVLKKYFSVQYRQYRVFGGYGSLIGDIHFAGPCHELQG